MSSLVDLLLSDAESRYSKVKLFYDFLRKRANSQKSIIIRHKLLFSSIFYRFHRF